VCRLNDAKKFNVQHGRKANIQTRGDARNRGDQCYARFVQKWERSDQHKTRIALGVPLLVFVRQMGLVQIFVLMHNASSTGAETAQWFWRPRGLTC